MTRPWFGVIGLLCFLLLATGARAQYGYVRPTNDSGGPPTNADLEIYDGASHSITVELLNLTPYDIQFNNIPFTAGSDTSTWSISAADEAAMQDTNPTVPKSFMFVPVGVPSFIPAAPAQDFLNYGDPGFVQGYRDTTTHPYPMLFSWDDQGGFVKDNWVTWTIKGVKYLSCDTGNPPNCVYDTQNVHLGLWMDRIKPSSTWFTSAFFPELSKTLTATFGGLGIFAHPLNPFDWIAEALALADLGKTSYDTAQWAKENTQPNDGSTMWVASYIIPNPTSPCVLNKLICTPSTMTVATGDAVYSQWTPAFAGPETAQGAAATYAAEADLIVTVHVFRGQKAKQCDPTLYPNHCPLGSESVVIITVERPEDFKVGALAAGALDTSTSQDATSNPVGLFLLQAGAGRIRQLLVKHGRTGLTILRSIIEGLNLAQRQVLQQLVRDMGSGRHPTRQERQVVRFIADRLQARLLEAGLN